METIGNPAGNIVDIAAVTEMAHRYGVCTIADNTVASPALLKPIEHGVDIVVHSVTKYMGGHGTTLGGVIVDSGNFPGRKTQHAIPDSISRRQLPRRSLYRSLWACGLCWQGTHCTAA